MNHLDDWYRDLARTVPPFEFMDHAAGRRGPVASVDGWEATQPHGSFIQEDMRRDEKQYYRGGVMEICRLREELEGIFWEYRLALFPLGVMAAWKVTELYKWIRQQRKKEAEENDLWQRKDEKSHCADLSGLARGSETQSEGTRA